MINLYNIDCMEAMKKAPDNHWNLAIVDPPYGIHNKLLTTQTLNKSNKFALKYMEKNWDKSRPTQEYFTELQRVSKNQIIWGGNYFSDMLPPSRGWICWDKVVNFTCINGELAWSSYDKALKIFRRMGTLDQGINIRKEVQIRIHPTQKPVALYTWLLDRYAKPGNTILDTHLGSGSIAVACHDMGFQLDGFELDKEYYLLAKKRLENHQRQLKLFL